MKRWLSPMERRRRNNRLRWWAIGLGLGYLLCALLDRRVFLACLGRGYHDNDWGRMFRVAGFLPTWLVVAAAMALVDRGGGRAWRRAWPLVAGAAGSGLAAEVLKRLIGRERPLTELHFGTYYFKPFLHGLWDDHNLGIPSSHAAVAFGAAFMLARLWPAVWPAALLAAVGCAVQRVAAGAHFLSDVYTGAVVAYIVTAWVSGRLGAGGQDRLGLS
jgi:membrane-associated phospholipid phosphatase